MLCLIFPLPRQHITVRKRPCGSGRLPISILVAVSQISDRSVDNKNVGVISASASTKTNDDIVKVEGNADIEVSSLFSKYLSILKSSTEFHLYNYSSFNQIINSQFRSCNPSCLTPPLIAYLAPKSVSILVLMVVLMLMLMLMLMPTLELGLPVLV